LPGVHGATLSRCIERVTMLVYQNLSTRGGQVRLGVDSLLVRNGDVLLRVYDVWASRDQV
jgi:hypothetical protein